MSHLLSNSNIKIFAISFIFLIGLNTVAKSNSIEDIITKINTIENRIKVLEKATFNKTNSSQSNLMLAIMIQLLQSNQFKFPNFKIKYRN